MNSYLLGDVLLDAGTRHSTRRILRELRGQTVRAVALTHAHPDHQGAAHAICGRLGVPLWCGVGDADLMEAGELADARPELRRLRPSHWVNRVMEWGWRGPAHPVAHRLHEGDEVGGFSVLEVPGHSRGHLAFWRERDRVLVLGDALTNMNLVTTAYGLHDAKRAFTLDPEQNRASAQRLAELRPYLVCFGHGPPLRDPERFRRFVATLGT